MLRISTVAEDGSVYLKLEGKLLAPWCAELQAICQQAMSRGLPVRIDLAEVTYVDAQGVELLQLLRRQRISLGPCSNFVIELLHAERT